MKFDDLIETIDMLDAEQADAVIDWQMTDSPAAKVQRTGCDGGWDHPELEVLGERVLQVGPDGVQRLVSGPTQTVPARGRPRINGQEGVIHLHLSWPRIEHVYEMTLGQDMFLYLPRYADWTIRDNIEERTTTVGRMPVTTVRYNVGADTWVNATAHRISWYYPDHHYDALERMVTDEMAQCQASGPLGRKSIGDGWEAQLGVNNGVVKAALVRYAQ